MGVKNDDELVEGHERPAATVSLRPVLEPVGPMHKPEDEERQEGGALAWNTGIAEVELPVDFKLKNIEVCLCARVRAFGCLRVCVRACVSV
jgi:hypothetical protein